MKLLALYMWLTASTTNVVLTNKSPQPIWVIHVDELQGFQPHLSLHITEFVPTQQKIETTFNLKLQAQAMPLTI